MESWFIPYTATTVLPTGNTLVLAPHPDDEVLGCAGAIMQHVAQGDEVTVVIVADGRSAIAHSNDLDMLQYIEIRKQESNLAAQILGYGQPKFWNKVDREVRYSEEFVQKVSETICSLNISRVYAPSVMEIHPDHYAMAMIAAESVRRCGQGVNLIMYEVGVPSFPNLLLDITQVVDRKLQAFACFSSQQSIQDYSRHIQGLNSYRTYTLPPQVSAAEAYYTIGGEELRLQPLAIFGRSRLSNTLSDAYTKIHALEGIIAKQAKELTAVYCSRSWRLTALLRWLNRFFRI